MRFLYRLFEDRAGWHAETEGIEAFIGHGASPATAVLDLRTELDSRYAAAVGEVVLPGATLQIEPVAHALPASLLDVRSAA